MNNAATYVKNQLLANANLQGETAAREYWELAPEKTPLPFITYGIRENTAGSKDRSGDYDILIYIWHNSLMEAAILGNYIKETPGLLKYRGGESGYTDGEAKEAFLKLQFNLKILN